MIRTTAIATAMTLLAAIALVAGPGLSGSGRAHEGHEHAAFSAGEPGDPKKPARTVKVRMLEGSGKMSFEPALIQVRRGEQVRFVVLGPAGRHPVRDDAPGPAGDGEDEDEEVHAEAVAPASASSTSVAWVTPFEPRAENGFDLRK